MAVRCNILFSEVGSLYELFKNRKRQITLYKGPAADATSKVRTLIPSDPNMCVVDLGNQISKSVTFVTEPEPGRCWYCKRITKDETRVGIPVRMRDDKLHCMMIVDIEGRACHYSCAYSYLRDRDHLDIYSGRLIILRKIFELIFEGKEKLNPAPDFSLLKENGGDLTDEMFDSGTRGFTANPCLKYRVCSAVFESSSERQ